MPRKNPIPDYERKIGARLREFREDMGLSQVAFARRAGLDSTLLTTYELGRAKLNYPTGRKILSAFGMSPRWLATGDGRKRHGMALPTIEELGVGPRTPFSEVYQRFLKDRVEKDQMNWERDPMTKPSKIEVNGSDAEHRVFAHEMLSNWLDQWIELVPDDKFNEFINGLFHDGWRLVRAMGDEPIEVTERRRKELDHARLRARAIKLGVFIKAADSPPYVSKIIDTYPDAATVPLMHPKTDKTRTWAAWLVRIQELCKEPGTKAELARYLGVSRQHVTNWVSGKSSPTADYALHLIEWVRSKKATIK